MQGKNQHDFHKHLLAIKGNATFNKDFVELDKKTRKIYSENKRK